jgi:hypothetical protein
MAAKCLWPTPRASEGNQDFAKLSRSRTGISLPTAVKLWPTPQAHDAATPKTPEQLQAAKARAMEKHGRPMGFSNLNEVIQMYPSPAARDWRSGKGRQENGHTPQLPEIVGGQLNPMWVEWLMGFPLGWTVLNRLAMPLSRKSRKSSVK